MTTMPRPLMAALAAATLAMPIAAAAQTNPQPWILGLRAMYVSPNVNSSIPGLDVDSNWWIEGDLTFFFNRNLAAELVAAFNKHEVTLNGTSIGKVGVLPPTLTLQWHFTDLGPWKPYVGAGLNYTNFYENDLANNTLYVKTSSWGAALQGGVDYEIQKNLYVNFDVKYVWMNTDVYSTSTGANVGSLDINPWLIGAGVRWRF